MTSTKQALTQIRMTAEQVVIGAQAATEVLNGAPVQRVLQITNELVLAKMLLRALATGELVVARPETLNAARKPRAAARSSAAAGPAAPQRSPTEL